MSKLSDQVESDKQWIADTLQEVEARRQEVAKNEEKYKELQKQRDVVAKSIQSAPAPPQISANPNDALVAFEALLGCFQAMASCANCPEEIK
eukprot:8810138-Pyramimonas_sp.AAC.1